MKKDDLNNELSKIDRITEELITKEDILWQLGKKERQYQRQLIKEVSFFFLIGLILMTGFTISFLKLPILFIVLQIFVLILIPFLVYIENRSNNPIGRWHHE
ncbi:hypothetical protein GMB86_12825 [Terrilactibacillus sp. BCM23-1]|uniref:YxlC family protein n=1 Tax=Terrilactibacillus tamarindi TaxID=2599694 RepID=A0A6N8CT49_9BACI|nr:YxlC family protein [Terrilactibacillus tamarindi]MTT32890.1 hypothetical protein [Terrilactibacillus tamarindi]